MYITLFTIGFFAAFLVFGAMLFALRNLFRDGRLSAFLIGLGNSITQLVWVALAFLFLHFFKPQDIPIINRYFISVTAIALFIMAWHTHKYPHLNKLTMTAAQWIILPAIGLGISIPFLVRITTYLGLWSHYGIFKYEPFSAAQMAAIGVATFLGNLLFWILFVTILSYLCPCGRMSPTGLMRYNRIMVVIFAVLGLLTLGSLAL